MISLVLALIFIFAGISSLQFHSYLFEIKGFSPYDIGLILASGSVSMIISGPLQSLSIKYFKGPEKPLIILVFVSALSLAALPFSDTFFSVTLYFTIYSFAASAIFPLVSVYTMNIAAKTHENSYFKYRSAGTLGFLLACIVCWVFGKNFNLKEIFSGFSASYIIAGFILIYIYNKQEFKIDRQNEKQSDIKYPSLNESLKTMMSGHTFVLLFLISMMCFCHYLSSNIQGNYIVNQFGIAKEAISLAWIISTFFEVFILYSSFYIIEKIGIRGIFILGFAGACIKITGMAAAASFNQFLVSMLFHGFFVTGLLTGFDIYLKKTYSKQERSLIQPLCFIFTLALPKTIASYLSGAIWNQYSLWTVLYFSSVIAVLTFFTSLIYFSLSMKHYKQL